MYNKVAQIYIYIITMSSLQLSNGSHHKGVMCTEVHTVITSKLAPRRAASAVTRFLTSFHILRKLCAADLINHFSSVCNFRT